MKYIIYALVIALVIWAVYYLIRTVRRQLRGDCGCGRGKDCKHCGSRR